MQIQKVIPSLLLKQPFYGYIAASVIPVESRETRTISIMTSPYIRLLYNREWFESLRDEHAVGSLMHELLHLILLHPFRKGNRERNLWLVACDMAVNENIDPSLLPADAITAAKIGREFGVDLPERKSAELYYDILLKNEGSLSFIEANKEITIVLSSGLELKASDSIEGDASEINRNALKSALSGIIDQAGAEGEIPGEIEGYINELYMPAQVNWRNVLKRFLSGKGRVLKTKSFKKESRRFEGVPGNKRTLGTRALLALDESGSVTDAQVSGFFNEVAAIKEITGADIQVTEFDTGCTEPVPLKMYLRARKRTRNGGTDFRPVFELADKMRMPLVVVFTDGDGPAPESVNQKVLWVLTRDGRKPAGYGHSVSIEV